MRGMKLNGRIVNDIKYGKDIVVLAEYVQDPQVVIDPIVLHIKSLDQIPCFFKDSYSCSIDH